MPFDTRFSTNPLLAARASKTELVVGSLDFMRKVPMIQSGTETFRVAKDDLAEIRRVELGSTAVGADIKRVGLSKEYVNFNLEPYTAAKALSGIEYSTLNSEGFAMSQQRLASRVSAHVALKMQKKLETTILTAASYPVNNATLNISNPASDNGVLDKVIDAAKAIHLQCGLKPNTLVVTSDVFYQLLKQDELKLLYAGGNTGVQGPISEQWLSNATGLPNIIVLDGAINTAGPNATASNAFLSTGFMLICYMNPMTTLGKEEPSFLAGGYLQVPTELGVSGNIRSMTGEVPFPIRIADNFDGFKAGHGAYEVAAEAVVDFKLVYPELGYLYTVTV